MCLLVVSYNLGQVMSIKQYIIFNPFSANSLICYCSPHPIPISFQGNYVYIMVADVLSLCITQDRHDCHEAMICGAICVSASSVFYLCQPVCSISHVFEYEWHIYTSINWALIVSGNGLFPIHSLRIIWTIEYLLLIWLLGNDFR